LLLEPLNHPFAQLVELNAPSIATLARRKIYSSFLEIMNLMLVHPKIYGKFRDA
jgi:hypothetical protein